MILLEQSRFQNRSWNSNPLEGKLNLDGAYMHGNVAVVPPKALFGAANALQNKLQLKTFRV